MNEKLIERKLVSLVRTKGGLAIKFFCPSFTGLPDRIVLMPKGRVYFAELKTTGEKLRARQVIVKKQFEDLGFEVFVIDTELKLQEFINHITNVREK